MRIKIERIEETIIEREFTTISGNGNKNGFKIIPQQLISFIPNFIEKKKENYISEFNKEILNYDNIGVSLKFSRC